jgi:tetratricopeptide (TPR) repeat protein
VARQLQGDFTGAVDYERRALEMRRALGGDESMDVAESWQALGVLQARLGDLPASLEAAREALRIRRKLLPEGHPSIAIALSSVGNTARDLGQLDMAIEMLREGVAILRAVHPDGHAVLADGVTNLALALDDAGAEGAEELFLEALAMTQRLFDADHREIGWSWSNLGWMRYGADRCVEAVSDLTRAVAILARPSDPDPFASVTIKNLALALECAGQPAAAEARYREAVAHGREHLPEGHPFLGTQLQSLGSFLVRAGRLDEAEPTLREALERRTQTLPEGHFAIASAKVALGECLMRTARYEEAEALLLAGHASTDARAKERAGTALVELYTLTARPDRAATYSEP